MPNAGYFTKTGVEVEVRHVEKCCGTCRHGDDGYEGECKCRILSQKKVCRPTGKEYTTSWVWCAYVCDLWEKEIEDAKV